MKKIIFIIIAFMIGADLYAAEVTKQKVSGEITNIECENADGFLYAKIGYGAVFGKFNGWGVSTGFGYRREIDDLVLDLGFLNSITPNSGNFVNNERYDFFYDNLLQIQVLYFLSPVGKNSFYAGGGIAYNTIYYEDYHHNNYREYSFKGVAGMATFGYEIMRARPIRCFIQLEITMPFGKTNNTNYLDDSYYGSSLALSMGIGF